jgi:uncharacterized protein (DUF885 family)
VRLQSFLSAGRTVRLLCVLAFVALPSAASAKAAGEGARLSAIAERYFEAWLALHPIEATTILSDPRFEGRFENNLTPSYRARERALYRRTLAALETIDAEQLSARDKLNRQVLALTVRENLQELDFNFYLTPIQQMNSLPLDLIHLATAKAQQPFRTVENYRHFLERIAGLPGWVDQAIANMRDGMAQGVVQPKVLMQRVLPQLQSQVVDDPTQSGFYLPVMNFPASFSKADRMRLERAYRLAIEQQISPAFARLRDFIAAEYLPRCRDTSGLAGTPDGAAKYAFLVRENTSTDLSPEQIHATGLREVARIRGELAKVQSRLGFEGGLDAFLKSLDGDPKLKPYHDEAEILAAYRAIRARVEPRLGQLFGTIPAAALEIRPEDEVTKATAADHYQSGSPDGSRPGVFYVVVRDVKQYFIPQMTALFLHEALPGHHFQGSVQQALALPKFRKYQYINAYGEGWALYSESLGESLGVYDDPYQYLGRLLMEMHRAIRLVVDTGMHSSGWTREQAIEYSLANEGGPEADAVQEIERYMAWPGQALGYKLGELTILDLRRKAENALGAKFDIRAFHDEILKDGALPLGLLETKMNAWVAKQKS